jgi:DNA repair photolyase
MGIYGGLTPEDWRKWGQFTTFKINAAELASRGTKRDQVIYCSPLVDPYQPAEREQQLMPSILSAITRCPPNVFVLQTRSPLILRDVALLQEAAERTVLRISMSITTDSEEVRHRYEGRCEPIEERLEAIRLLREAGLEVYATLAPLLPCQPQRLTRKALDASCRHLIGDPLHVRGTKRHGATTREPAFAIARRYGEEKWFDPEFQAELVKEIAIAAGERGYRFVTGPAGFSSLARI